jgi:hypothetical protein
MANQLEKIPEHICHFYTMATDTHAWPETCRKTDRRFNKAAREILRGYRAILERIVRLDQGFSAI